MKTKIRLQLLSCAQEDYKQFSSKLLPGVKNILGVRLPVLRKIAKQIYISENHQQFILSDDEEFMEELMIKGMIIGLIQNNNEAVIKLVKNFIPKINNWSVCDSFCASLKFAKNNKDIVWQFIRPYFKSDKQFEVRFAVVMFLNYFVEEKYIKQAFELFDLIKQKGYYAQMAIAWAISICFINYEEKTIEYLKISKLDDWTYNKAIQKCLESSRISKGKKLFLKKFKR